MNTEKTPTIYGTLTFEQFNDAIETVCKYVEGLANTYAIKDMLTEEHRNKLEPDLLMGGLSMMRINMTHGKLIEAMKGLKAELLEKKAAEERVAQADPNDPSEPVQAEPNDPREPSQAEQGDTYEPKTENL